VWVCGCVGVCVYMCTCGCWCVRQLHEYEVLQKMPCVCVCVWVCVGVCVQISVCIEKDVVFSFLAEGCVSKL
jgi:hypothetical protein